MGFDRNLLKLLLVVMTLATLLFVGEVAVGLLWMNPIVPGSVSILAGWAAYGVFGGLLLLIVRRLDHRHSVWGQVLLVAGLALLLPVKLGLSHASAALVTAGLTAGLVGLTCRWTARESAGTMLSVLFLLLVAMSPDWFHGLSTDVSREILRGAGGAVLLAVGLGSGTRLFPYLEKFLWRRRMRVSVGLVLTVFLAAFAWSSPWGGQGFHSYFDGTVPHVRTPGNVSPEALPDIILVSVDTLRRDMVPPHGKEPIAAEALGELYRDSVRFEHVFSTSDWTLPAHASLFTGRLPVEHGAVRGRGSRIRADRPTYTQILKDLGYRTAAFTDGGYVSRKLGFGRGFDHVWEQRFESGDFLPGVLRLGCPDCGNPHPRESAAWLGRGERDRRHFSHNLKRARHWIDRRQGDEAPFFLFLHTYQVHDYWDLYPKGMKRLKKDRPELHDALREDGWPTPRKLEKEMGMTPLEYAGRKLDRGPRTEERIRKLKDLVMRRRRARWALYQYEARDVYSELSQFIDYLKGKEVYRDAYVVFLSDHGEGFRIHSGAWGHSGRQLDEILVRVPTWIKYPGSRFADRTRRDLFQVTDVFPLLFRGMNLTPAEVLLNRKEQQGRIIEGGRTVVSGSSGSRSPYPKLFFRTACRKLIHDTRDGSTEILLKEADCTSEERADTDVLRGELQQRLERLERGPNPYRQPHFASDPELVRDLEGLGYL